MLVCPCRAHQPNELFINQINVHTQALAGTDGGRYGWRKTPLVIKQGDVCTFSSSVGEKGRGTKRKALKNTWKLWPYKDLCQYGGFVFLSATIFLQGVCAATWKKKYFHFSVLPLRALTAELFWKEPVADAFDAFAIVNESFTQPSETATVSEQHIPQAEVTEARRGWLTEPWSQQRHQRHSVSAKLAALTSLFNVLKKQNSFYSNEIQNTPSWFSDDYQVYSVHLVTGNINEHGREDVNVLIGVKGRVKTWVKCSVAVNSKIISLNSSFHSPATVS